MKKQLIKIICLLFLSFSMGLEAQVDSLWFQKIDSLFIAWNVPNHPGGAVGVMKNGKLIFSKAYGLASLEYLVPNTTSTIFNTGSVSKQCTAMGIVKLEEMGKLNFDDDIRQYIPELPVFQEKITIRHLLHHTSGLRSLHALFALAGWRGDDSRTNADLNRVIVKQKDLNFKPGSEYLYCNTGYMLMVNIIENITGEKFTDWMRHHIFEPLDMPHTYVEDQYNRVVPGNATSYYGRENFERAVEYWGYVGSGNMHSTTADLLTWLTNFSTPQPGWESSFEKLQTLDPLNDGTAIDYAFGVVVDTYLGKKRIQHGGAIGGFRAFVATYPDEQLSIAVLTNFSGGNPFYLGDQVAGILLGNPTDNTTTKNEIEAVKLVPKALQQFEGSYWNDREKYARKIYFKNDTLRYYRGKDNETPLIPVNDHVFQMHNTAVDVGVTFVSHNGNKKMLVDVPGQATATFHTIKTKQVTTRELSQYTGNYYSPELETTYRIKMKNDSLSIHHPRHGAIPLKRLFPDILSGDWPMNTIEIQRNARNQITGILISNGRVRNAWFEKH